MSLTKAQFIHICYVINVKAHYGYSDNNNCLINDLFFSEKSLSRECREGCSKMIKPFFINFF